MATIHDDKSTGAEALDRDLANTRDGELNILATSSPAGVLAAGNAAETDVSVAAPDPDGPDFSGGYLGG